MRAGVCAAQQTLSAEAAAVLKHSLSLSRRRGHAQVTPLHVAATLLTSRSSLLRRACLKSQPHHQPSHHPLQCRALELCFNVALNRLPASPAPLVHHQPSLSNALVAALKRAQAHQRRGCVDQQQQQPLIAIKVELEQLILSILDDPSVSRVMREAGFSSTAVKNNLDDYTNSASSAFQFYNNSGGIYSTPSSPPAESRIPLLNPTAFFQPHLFSHSSKPQSPFFSPQKKPQLVCMNDVKSVMDVLVGERRRNTVIVGDSLPMAEALLSQLMSHIQNGSIHVPDELKSAQLVKFQFSSVPLVLMSKEEVNMNVAHLKRKVDSFASIRRVIIYIGDLKWTVDQRENSGAVDHLITEIGKLLAWYSNSNMKVWLMATANYQTYVNCQMKQPPLDVQWALQPVSIPSGALGLSLTAATSARDSRIVFSESSSTVSDKKLMCLKEETNVLTCCQECTYNYEKEAALKSFSDKETASAELPYWLKPHANQTLVKNDLGQLRKKYNKLCQSLHVGRNYYSNSSYPSWLNKNNIYVDSETNSFPFPASKLNINASTLPRFRRQQSCHIEFSFSNGSSKNSSKEPNLGMMEDQEVSVALALGNSTYNNAMKHEKFAISELLKENIPWQMETIPSIVEALMDSEANHDQFMLMQGNDSVAKRRLALAIAESVLGSSELLFIVSMRSNEKTSGQNREKIEMALKNQEKIIVLIEDAEFLDHELAQFLDDLFKTRGSDPGRSVFILTTDGDEIEYPSSVVEMKLVVNETSSVTDLHQKRRSVWDTDPAPRKSKIRRSDEMEEVSSAGLDLNVRVDDEEAELDKLGELSPVSSDLTRENTIEPPHNSLSFPNKIKNRFVFNRGDEQDKMAKEMFMSKFKRAFNETSGLSNLQVEEKVLERVLGGCGLYLNGSFEKWLKDVFQMSLGGVSGGGREKVSVRLCLVGEGESCAKDGFMGTSLPKRIQFVT